jgi:ABC-type nitrate/sulfonate/bicarbonate transport system permease component
VRKVVGVVVGMIAGGTLVGMVEGLGHLLFPLPEGVDETSIQSLKGNMDKIPLGSMLFVLLGWIVGSGVGSAVAVWISRSSTVPGLIVGGLLMSGGIANLAMLPHPIWFSIAGFLVFLPSAWVGAQLVRQKAD